MEQEIWHQRVEQEMWHAHAGMLRLAGHVSLRILERRLGLSHSSHYSRLKYEHVLSGEVELIRSRSNCQVAVYRKWCTGGGIPVAVHQ